MEDEFNISKIVLCYDPRIWNACGRDYGHNGHCWQPAEIINIRLNVPSIVDDYIYPILFDVRYLYDGRISKGHFKNSLKRIN